MLTATGGPSQPTPTEQKDDNPKSNGDALNYKREEQKAAEDADVSDLSSIAESSDDDLQDDEETGLTAKQRRQRRRRRKQRRQLDARIAGGRVFSVGLADRNVLRKLLANAGLILMWYFFSLAISIVSCSLFQNEVRDVTRLTLAMCVTVQ
jgi:solute carrier family 35 protein C2